MKNINTSILYRFVFLFSSARIHYHRIWAPACTRVLLGKSAARESRSVPKQAVAGAGGASKKVMGGVCSLTLTDKLSASGHCTVPAEI